MEIDIWLKSGVNEQTASPKVTMIPIIPIPRGTADAPNSRFQVAAYDPDDGSPSSLHFRWGTEQEYGAEDTAKSLSAHPAKCHDLQ